MELGALGLFAKYPYRVWERLAPQAGAIRGEAVVPICCQSLARFQLHLSSLQKAAELVRKQWMNAYYVQRCKFKRLDDTSPRKLMLLASGRSLNLSWDQCRDLVEFEAERGRGFQPVAPDQLHRIAELLQIWPLVSEIYAQLCIIFDVIMKI